MSILYFSLVGSNLEFGSEVWSPNYTTRIKNSDYVQYKFLKMIRFKLNFPISRGSYNLQTFLIGIQLCELRRKIDDLMFLCDLLNGNIYSPDLLYY